MAYLYILGTVLFTVYGQLILKWRIPHYGSLPANLGDKVIFLLKLLYDPFILSGFLSAFIASLFWMAAMTHKIELSKAYPLTIMSLVLVFSLSIVIFHESITTNKLLGIITIILGVFLVSRSL